MSNWVQASALQIGQSINLTAQAMPPIDGPAPAADWRTITDFRPQSRDWPMSVAIRVTGDDDWLVLPAERWCEVEEAEGGGG